MLKRIAIIAALAVAGAAAAQVTWPTFRGNNARTGAVQDKVFIEKPKVIWSYKAPEHFVATPVPAGDRLIIAGLGAFNAPQVRALSLDAQTADRVLFTKTSPLIQHPTVCAPAVLGDYVVFGDGMHQTDNATLHCIHRETGRPLWRYELPGKLVHIEASPIIDNNRVYVAAGDAGIICVELKKVTLDGKEQDLAAVIPQIDTAWQKMAASYDEQKKKDPDFALPPDETKLPRPSPKLIWHKGQKQWHVDAPLAISGDSLIVASSFIEEDKAGKRAILCLNKNDGSVLWEVPLDINPWGGVTVTTGGAAGDTVLVACSSIRFDRKLIPEAKGEVVALDLANGNIKWRKPVNGGVLGNVTVAGANAEITLYTSTDMKVRAVETATGNRLWSTLTDQPYFAGVAVSGGLVYAGDLGGNVHALQLTDGAKLWSINVGRDPAVQAPGAIFGAPVIAKNQLLIATANLQCETPDAPGAVVSIADQSFVVAARAAQQITIDAKQKRITIPATIAPRKLPTLKDIYPLEVIATYPTPEGQKAHETVIITTVKPSDVHKALESFGLKPGKPSRTEDAVPTGPEVKLSLVVPGLVTERRILPIERTIIDKRTGKPLPALTWHFTGSAFRQLDPEKPERSYGADLTGTFATIYPVTDETVLQSNLPMSAQSLLKLEINANLLPPEGTPVELLIEVK